MGQPMAVLPERLSGPRGVLLRRWRLEDARALSIAVAESLDHLRPWMAWAAQEPLTLQERRSRIAAFEGEWAAGGDVVLGAFLGDEVIGGCGLHRRIAADGLELGYWIHERFTRRGLATLLAGLLTDVALALPGITHAEIHHDKANVASAGVPRKLGYSLIEEVPDQREAPAESGIECQWRMTREAWSARPRCSYP